jgi:predicted RNA-binding Zn ribbon-like protein
VHAFPCGTLFLDFVGTLRARRATEPTEMLASPEALDMWFVESGMVDVPPEADLGDLLAARRLREAVYSLTASVLAGETLADEALSEVNRQAAGLPVGVRLDRDGSRHRVGTVSQALTLLARETVETLGGPEGDLLRECARPECTQTYLDRSRGHRREWCAMETCGNRVKAAAYRARRRGVTT